MLSLRRDPARRRERQTARLPDELFQLSLRHLAIAADGTMAVVIQYEVPSDDLVPLLALHRPGGALETVVLPDRILGRLRNHCGTAAFDATGRILAATSPVGGVAVLWDVRQSRCPGYAEIADGCDLAASGGAGCFVVTSGRGGAFFVVFAAPTIQRRAIPWDFLDSGRWDNHVMRLSFPDRRNCWRPAAT